MEIRSGNIFLNMAEKEKMAFFKEMIFASDIDESIKEVAYKKVKAREEIAVKEAIVRAGGRIS